MDQQFLQKLVAYMRHNEYLIFTGPREFNIVWMEGLNLDGSQNRDALDGWNDLCVVFDYDPVTREPRIRHLAVGTTEPGRAATISKAAKARQGVARIAFGQYTAWRMGWHKNDRNHPALVQRGSVRVHRDLNADGFRTGDAVTGASGINMHSTRPGYRGQSVGTWSEGCLVHRNWPDHTTFIALLRTDTRYQMNAQYLFTGTVVAGDALLQFEPTTA